MRKMGQKSEPVGYDQIYVLGLDRFGNPRGARFAVLKDSIVSAAMDMNCRVLIRQPDAVSALAMRLPLGCVHGSGKLVSLFIPIIRRELYAAILDAAQTSAQQERVAATTPATIH
jgi:hypothetical protein